MSIYQISDFARSYLRTRAAEMMEDSCVISRPGAQKVTWDSVTKKAMTTTDNVAVYTGPCRLWAIDAPSGFYYQDRETFKGTTRLSLPYGEVGVDDVDVMMLVTITSHVDPLLVGRSLTINEITRGGGLRASRVADVEFVDFEEN